MRFPGIRFVTLLLALALVSQPLEVRACEMETTGDATAAAMMSHHSGGEADTDCCAGTAPESPMDCGSSMGCAPCLTGVFLAMEAPRIALPRVRDTAFDVSSGDILPSHASPPYRPPIL